MQYHIQTDPIWEAFKNGSDCPLCEIYAASEARLLGQYLDEAVMAPEHTRKLFAGKNKLGLALQLHTRMLSVRSNIKPCNSHKQAVKQAAELEKTADTCVICRAVDEMMLCYARTIAQMFANEEEFRKVFSESNGFCMPHYTLLLRESNKAGGMTPKYLTELTYLQNRSLDRTANAVERFTNMFDYRNAGSAVKPDPETVPAAIKKLKGRIL